MPGPGQGWVPARERTQLPAGPSRGILHVLAAIAAGSAPGWLAGRRVAGCRASRADVPDGQNGADPAAPFPARSRRPADRVCDPQERFAGGRAMVVGRVQARLDPAQRVGDAGPVSLSLGGLLVVESPGGHSRSDYQTGRRLQQPVTTCCWAQADNGSVTQDDSLDRQPCHRVKNHTASAAGLAIGVHLTLAGEEQGPHAHSGRLRIARGHENDGHQSGVGTLALVAEGPHRPTSAVVWPWPNPAPKPVHRFAPRCPGPAGGPC